MIPIDAVNKKQNNNMSKANEWMETYVRMWYLRFIGVGSIRYRVDGARTHATAQLPLDIDPISNQLTDRSVKFQIENLQIAISF